MDRVDQSEVVETTEAAPAAAATPTPAVETSSGRRRGAVIALVIVLVGGFGVTGGAVYANSTLSAKYSPQQAALDYFAAQQKGDATRMMAVATFVHGNAASNDLFERPAVVAMLRAAQNTDLKDVKVLSMDSLDANTVKVGMSMTWAGVSRTAVYLVRRDTSQTHYLFYDTWRIQIPYTTLALSLPNQPGSLYVDGIFVLGGSTAKTVQAIAGYHTIKMGATSFYDSSDKMANGVDVDPTVKLDGNISAAATAAAAGAIKDTMNNFCDSSKYYGCTGHTYTAPNDGNIWYLTLPGYPEIDYRSYVYTFTHDPTADMKLVVTAEDNKMTASGTCAVTLTVDESQTYYFTGTWTATLTWSLTGFSGTHVTTSCAAAKA